MTNRAALGSRLIFTGLCSISCFSGCSSLHRHPRTGPRDDAFIAYWPPPENNSRLRLAVKDLIDVKGVVTTAGSEYISKNNAPAARDAKCMALARARHVMLVGKTNLSELAVAPSGLNGYFGTPRNPLNRRLHLIPGGSSSGSAVAVADGFADVAFGTDTAGSIRLPAACCGVVGLKTTLGLVPTQGVFPIERHLDTVGPMGKDVAHTVEGMDLLQAGFTRKYKTAVEEKPLAKEIRIGRLYLDETDPKIDLAIDQALRQAGFDVVQLNARFKAKWAQAEQNGTAVAAAGAWISDHQYLDKRGVATRTKAIITVGQIAFDTAYRSALKRRARWRRSLRRVFKQVDMIALPTIQHLPPKMPHFFRTPLFETRVLKLQNTVAVNFAGNPALALPVPSYDKRIPLTSLELVGPRFSEAMLLNAGRLIEASLKKSATNHAE